MTIAATGTGLSFVFDMNRASLLLLCLFLLPAGGCNLSQTLENAAKNITLSTKDPLKVDMKVDINVYQHDAPGKAKETTEKTDDIAEVHRRKYNRQAEIQKLKNDQFVAETHQGLLLLREQPAEQGGYVRFTVEKENADRKELMIEDARKQGRELHEIEKERYEANVRNSHPGEWIEVPDPARPDGYKLERKAKKD
jgi:hypothetical protein